MDSYTYDEKSEMLTAGHGSGSAVATNAYWNDGYITSQTVADGSKFEFSYLRGPQNMMHESQISDPRGVLTSFLFGRAGYGQTLPRLSVHLGRSFGHNPCPTLLCRLEAGLLCVCKIRNCGRLFAALVSPD